MATPDRPFESSNLRPEDFPSVEDSLQKVDEVLAPMIVRAQSLGRSHVICDITDEDAVRPEPTEPSVRISLDTNIYAMVKHGTEVSREQKGSAWIIVVQWEFENHTVHDTFQMLADGSVHCSTEYQKQDLGRFGKPKLDEAAAMLEADLRMQHPEEYEARGLVNEIHERVIKGGKQLLWGLSRERAKVQSGISRINQVEAHRLAGALQLPFVQRGIQEFLRSGKER